MKIVFCGGGTAGHVTPNLALIDELPEAQCYYIGGCDADKLLVAPYKENGKIVAYTQLSASKLQRKLTPKNLTLPFKLIKSIRQAKSILEEISPNIVFSKGGYVGLPVVIAAHRLKIPVIAHESDMSMGLANKITALYATKMLSTFPMKGTTCVGAIVRKQTFTGNKQKGLQTMGFDGRKPVFLVTGGSLGAKDLNDAVAQNYRLSQKFDVFVITGKGKHINCDFVKQAEFVHNIGDIFAAADVCLTRSGSNSLCELTLARVPFVTAPLTNCSRGEQLQNAKWFEENGCGICINNESLVRDLYAAVSAAYDNRATIIAKQQKQRNLYGTERVAKILSESCRKVERK